MANDMHPFKKVPVNKGWWRKRAEMDQYERYRSRQRVLFLSGKGTV